MGVGGWVSSMLAALAVAAGLPAAAQAAAAHLTPRELVGQRLVFSFRGLRAPPGLLRRIRRGEAAGVILFASNVGTREQTRALVARLQRAARHAPRRVRAPLLVMTDQEGGAVQRVPGGPRRSEAEVGATGRPGAAFRAGRSAGRNIGSLGIDVDLAPVVDVARPGGVIARYGRGFSADPAVVARMGAAFVRGLHAASVAATAKHFPGFGAAVLNTDDARVTIDAPLDTLRAVDERPYPAAIRAGVDLVMISSAVYPALDPDWPAALSRRIVTGELRRRLGFRGVTITDALDTPGVAGFGTPAQQAVRAVKAGDDLLLYSGDAGDLGEGRRGERALLRALRAGDLRPAELRAGARRVLTLRRR